MKTEFKSSFAKNLKSIKSKTVLEAVAKLIEVLRPLKTCEQFPMSKSLRRRVISVELSSVTIALESPSTKTRSHSFDAWIGKRFTGIFPNRKAAQHVAAAKPRVQRDAKSKESARAACG